MLQPVTIVESVPPEDLLHLRPQPSQAHSCYRARHLVTTVWKSHVRQKSSPPHLICRARVPSILARSYFVMYRVVILGLFEGCAGPSIMSAWPAPASGMSASPPSSACDKHRSLVLLALGHLGRQAMKQSVRVAWLTPSSISSPSSGSSNTSSALLNSKLIVSYRHS